MIQIWIGITIFFHSLSCPFWSHTFWLIFGKILFPALRRPGHPTNWSSIIAQYTTCLNHKLGYFVIIKPSIDISPTKPLIWAQARLLLIKSNITWELWKIWPSDYQNHKTYKSKPKQKINLNIIKIENINP